MEAVGKSIRGPQRMLVSHGSLRLSKLLDELSFVKIEWYKFHWFI